MRYTKRFLKWIFGLFVIAFIVKVWYESLSESHQRFVKNFVEQIPELPGRYSL